VETKEAIRQALPVFVTYKGTSLAGLVSALERQGFSRTLALELGEFLPLAFARAVLEGKGLRFPDYYVRVDGQGRERARRKLLQEPVFREALGMVLEVRQEGTDTLMAVAKRSAELHAINQALRSGKRAEQLVLNPPALSWSDDQEPKKKTQARTPKAWWQFWK
jgi:hypothetical protein